MIKKLDEAMIVRIAAGEVIERPASVAKELVENSIDAGSRNIVVRLERGGLGLIEVSDDGCGISREELPVAVERHATSKLTSIDDLERIATMGFRGEALATIAAAGRLTIVSRIRGGEASLLTEELLVEPAGRSEGTTMIVRDLFVKTPARLKFMKSESAEASRISDHLERLALSRPDISIELIRDGKKAFRTGGRGDLRETVGEIFGTEIAKGLLDVSGDVSGLISPTHLVRRNRTGFYYNLNGRPIEDKTISHAITAGYQGLLPGGEFPMVFITIAIDPSEVDVNVHPAKAEVRFRESPKIHHLVSHALRQRLRETDKPESRQPSAVAQPSVATYQPSAFQVEPLPFPSLRTARSIELKYSGEIRGRYLLAEDENGLVVIDQHAAHERVMFDRLMKDAQNGDIMTAPLLIPITIEMSASDRGLVESMIGLFAEIGFELEVWPDAIAVQAVPAVMSDCDITRVIRDTLDTVRTGGVAAPTKVPYARIAMEACKSAVKGTQRLDPSEARALLDDLAETTDPYNCPHGRPTMVKMSIEELDRKFGRL